MWKRKVKIVELLMVYLDIYTRPELPVSGVIAMGNPNTQYPYWLSLYRRVSFSL
jgi:hypothetical protein